jgi:alkane 1-monooxygenase
MDQAVDDEIAVTPSSGQFFYDANLYGAIPLLCVLAIAQAMLSRKLANFGTDGTGETVQFAVATLIVSYQYALIGATVGHELIHRTNSRVATVCSSLLLAFTLNTGFTIFHFRGHHHLVGLWQDPASARRGESWATFLVRSTAAQAQLAFRFEEERLKGDDRRVFSLRNRFLRRQFYPLAIAAISFLIGGIAALAAFLVAAIIGRCFHETINYVQHYGLVRAPDQPVAPRHTWNCYRPISNALQYNLPCHSVHHGLAGRPFWKLGADRNAPTLPYGYQTMAAIALIPPLWRRLMNPLLQQWDDQFASEAERAILRDRGWLDDTQVERSPNSTPRDAETSARSFHAR